MKFTRKYIKYPYKDREGRNRFIAKDLQDYFGNSILNIGGGGKRHLKKYLPDSIEYFEIDIAGSPDLRIDLENDLPIPIESEKYDTVICTDVLEHLDNIHEVFSELVRITKKDIILSLPNPFADSVSYFLGKVYKDNSFERKKNFGKFMKYYGLPYEKPADRHKWFFSFIEAEEFIEYQTAKYNLKIKEIIAIERELNLSNKILFKIICAFGGKNLKKDLLYKTLWCVLEKK